MIQPPEKISSHCLEVIQNAVGTLSNEREAFRQVVMETFAELESVGKQLETKVTAFEARESQLHVELRAAYEENEKIKSVFGMLERSQEELERTQGNLVRFRDKATAFNSKIESENRKLKFELDNSKEEIERLTAAINEQKQQLEVSKGDWANELREMRSFFEARAKRAISDFDLQPKNSIAAIAAETESPSVASESEHVQESTKVDPVQDSPVEVEEPFQVDGRPLAENASRKYESTDGDSDSGVADDVEPAADFEHERVEPSTIGYDPTDEFKERVDSNVHDANETDAEEIETEHIGFGEPVDEDAAGGLEEREFESESVSDFEGVTEENVEPVSEFADPSFCEADSLDTPAVDLSMRTPGAAHAIREPSAIQANDSEVAGNPSEAEVALVRDEFDEFADDFSDLDEPQTAGERAAAEPAVEVVCEPEPEDDDDIILGGILAQFQKLEANVERLGD